MKNLFFLITLITLTSLTSPISPRAFAQESTPSATIKSETTLRNENSTQTNSATITTTINSSATTGNNKANFNSGGDVRITTGSANSVVELKTQSNSTLKSTPSSSPTPIPTPKINVTSISPLPPQHPQTPLPPQKTSNPQTNQTLTDSLTTPLKQSALTNPNLAHYLDNLAIIAPKKKATPKAPPQNLFNYFWNLIMKTLS